MNNVEARSWLEKYAPLGINLAQEVMAFIVCLCCAVGYSLGYVFSYMNARSELYKWVNKKQVLIEGAKMLHFEELLGSYMNGFILVGVAIVVMLIYHYFYHYQDSKIIYLMKRLPNRWELHKRCFTLPIAGALIAVVVMILLWAMYLGIYLLFTPQQCLPL